MPRLDTTIHLDMLNDFRQSRLFIKRVSELFGKVRDASGGTFQLTTEFTVGDDDNAVAMGRVTASRAGKTLEGRNIFVVQCDNGRVTRGYTVPMDQYTFDEFWR